MNKYFKKNAPVEDFLSLIFSAGLLPAPKGWDEVPGSGSSAFWARTAGALRSLQGNLYAAGVISGWTSCGEEERWRNCQFFSEPTGLTWGIRGEELWFLHPEMPENLTRKALENGWTTREAVYQPPVSGRFSAQFASFADGVRSLVTVSENVAMSLGLARWQIGDDDDALLDQVLRHLEGNASDRWASGQPTVSLYVGVDGGVEYTTTGGTQYGWKKTPEMCWEFFVQHPAGRLIPPHSGLRRSALRAGWHEEIE